MKIRESFIINKNTLISLKEWIIANRFLFLIILLNILLHLPRTSHMQGNDAYVVVWMAKAMSNGWYESWTINPLSIFGYYPYSSYPAGGIFILSLLFRVGFTMDLAVYIYSMIFMFIGITSSYFLGKILFKEDKKTVYWFVLFFTLSPLFIDFTYWTCSLRGPFLSILPIALYFILKFLETPSIKNFIFVIISSIILLSMHALLIGYSIYLVTALTVFVLPKFKNLIFIKKLQDILKNKRVSILIIFLFYLSFFILSLNLFGAKGWVFNFVTKETTIVQSLNGNVFFIISLLAYTYVFFGFGLITILFVFGFLLQFNKSSNVITNKLHKGFFITAGFFVSIIIPFMDYAPLFILPWVCFYSSIFIRYLNRRFKKNRKLFYFICIWIVFLIYLQRIGLTSMATYFLVLLLVGSLILLTISIYEILKFSNSYFHIISKLSLVIIFGIMLSSTAFTSLDDQNSSFPNYSLSNDEIIIAEYLEENNINNRIIVSYNQRVGRRIQAIGFQPVILTSNPPAMLYYHYLNLSEEYIRSVTNFAFHYIFRYGTPFVANVTARSLETDYLYKKVLELDLRNSSDYSIAIHEFQIGYVLLSSNPEDNVSIEGFSNNLFESIIETGNVKINTSHLILYELAPS